MLLERCRKAAPSMADSVLLGSVPRWCGLGIQTGGTLALHARGGGSTPLEGSLDASAVMSVVLLVLLVVLLVQLGQLPTSAAGTEPPGPGSALAGALSGGVAVTNAPELPHIGCVWLLPP